MTLICDICGKHGADVKIRFKSPPRFDYRGWNGCCITCKNRMICDDEYWWASFMRSQGKQPCDICLCEECSWYEFVPEVGKGFCAYPRKPINTRFDEILEELGLHKEGLKCRKQH